MFYIGFENVSVQMCAHIVNPLNMETSHPVHKHMQIGRQGSCITYGYKPGEQTHGRSVTVYTECKLLSLGLLIATRPPHTNKSVCLGVWGAQACSLSSSISF